MSEHGLIAHPLRLVVRDAGDEGAALCCPVCGMDYVHPEQVAVDQGKTRTVIGRESTCVTTPDRETKQRGSLIALDFWCENGHRFRYQLEFHKGQMFCELHAGDHDEQSGSDELWRS